MLKFAIEDLTLVELNEQLKIVVIKKNDAVLNNEFEKAALLRDFEKRIEDFIHYKKSLK